MAYADPFVNPTGALCLDNLGGFVPTPCCALSQDNTILAIGGIDKKLTLSQWRGYMEGKDIVKEAVRVNLQDELSMLMSYVLSIDFARKEGQPFVACGCFDGSVRVVKYDTSDGLKAEEIGKDTIKHEQYVRAVAWASHDNLLASASADGTVLVHKIVWNGEDDAKLEKVQELKLSGPVEALCFHKEKLVCYARGSPELSYFDLQENFKESKVNLNKGDVSFEVMDIAANGDYLALATNTSRNIIIEFETGKHIRDLDGHKNEDIAVLKDTPDQGELMKTFQSWFYTPKIAWSLDGKNLYGNTQDGAAICIWEVETGNLVNKLEGYHERTIYDMVSYQTKDSFGHTSEILVTNSIDKKVIFWFSPLSI